MSKWADSFEKKFKNIGSLKRITRELIKQNADKIRKNVKKEVEIKW